MSQTNDNKVNLVESLLSMVVNVLEDPKKVEETRKKWLKAVLEAQSSTSSISPAESEQKKTSDEDKKTNVEENKSSHNTESETDAKKKLSSDTPVSVPNSAQNTSKSADSPAANPKPKPRHAAICDHCRRTIIGIRFKCANCDDYDLCEICEVEWRGNERHDDTHVFLKIELPVRSRPFKASPAFKQCHTPMRRLGRVFGIRGYNRCQQTAVTAIPAQQEEKKSSPPQEEEKKSTPQAEEKKTTSAPVEQTQSVVSKRESFLKEDEKKKKGADDVLPISLSPLEDRLTRVEGQLSFLCQVMHQKCTASSTRGEEK